jgi:hypothetical protein
MGRGIASSATLPGARNGMMLALAEMYLPFKIALGIILLTLLWIPIMAILLSVVGNDGD